MKFTINRTIFTQQINNVQRAIPSKTTINILYGIKLAVSEQGITLIGSDADISIESFIATSDDIAKLNIEKTGEIVLPARLLSEIVKKLPTDEVEIDVDERFTATITSGNAEFQIIGINGNEYPRLPEIDIENQIVLPTLTFKKMINQTIFAASNQESRPVLTGIHLVLGENFLTAVATDSHRLSQRQIPLQLEKEQTCFEAITIPKKTMSELAKIVPDESELTMSVANQQIIFHFDQITIYSRLLEGNYPATDRLIPTTTETELVVNASDFLQAIDRASLLSHEGKNNIVHLEIDNNKVELSVKGNEIGNVAEEINYESADGEALKISFNPDYMKDALRSFGDILVKIQFNSPVRPMLLSSLEKNESAYNELIQLLTPVRTH
ncbi:DNA polymerase III subunit beta [Facklamia lactis]|uniref:DNA polymerase III subunit beta n=1 Tax=Facklamia lactis TaxID=2749967 RepID=UPI0018CE0D6E|nr:DNA polymerase III subunit beta [Facklamia lactis]MBG9981306.1 DNA polymerase III subunit beta [Facklamia lactis]